MEALRPSLSTINTTITSLAFSTKKLTIQTYKPKTNLPISLNLSKQRSLSASSSSHSHLFFSFISSSSTTKITSKPSIILSSSSSVSRVKSDVRHWMILMRSPPQGLNSKVEIIDYYVDILSRVLGSEKEAQMCIYNASCDTHFGFCCDIDEEASIELASLPEVLSVRPDRDYNSEEKDYSSNVELSYLPDLQTGNTLLFPLGKTKHWLVRMNKPGVAVVTKAQMVDYYVETVAKVLGNEKDAQMCIYHVSWKSNFGFCCELDEESAQELAGAPGVLSVQPDENFKSENKDYGGNNMGNNVNVLNSSEACQTTPVRTKKLFVTGLSFYTSEKTLRAAFEGFGELVEVKIIMDKISKRSKGYAFIEYTTEEAASAALKEMNGKIINGWMIVVDVAKPSPPRNIRIRRRTVA